MKPVTNPNKKITKEGPWLWGESPIFLDKRILSFTEKIFPYAICPHYRVNDFLVVEHQELHAQSCSFELDVI